MTNTSTLENQILGVIEELGSKCAILGGIPLQELYREIKARKILNADYAIRNRLKNLEARSEITIIDWHVRQVPRTKDEIMEGKKKSTEEYEP